MTMHIDTPSINRLMAAFLMLVIGVIGPVQASVHAASMTGAVAHAETSGPDSALTDSHLVHSGQHQEHQYHVHSGEFHLGADSPCVELCLMMSLVPSVNSELARPVGGSVLSADIGAPSMQGQPATPPPKRLS